MTRNTKTMSPSARDEFPARRSDADKCAKAARESDGQLAGRPAQQFDAVAIILSEGQAAAFGAPPIMTGSGWRAALAATALLLRPWALN